MERLLGTLTGAGAGFLLLYNVQAETVLFGTMIIAMVIGYSFLQIQYFVSVAAITVYVLLAFHFLHPADFKVLATDRVIDTAIGSAISFTAALFFLPKWEQEQVHEYIHKLMEANLRYFSTAAKAFYDNAPEIVVYKIARKDSYVALANLSDAFQRLLSEPRNKIRQPELLHHLVVSNHMLSSHIATLGTYSRSLAQRYRSDAFKPVADSIALQMQMAITLSQNNGSGVADTTGKGFSWIRDIIQGLLAQRVSELTEGAAGSNVRKTLSGFKTITDQFELIYTITIDINNVLKKMKVQIDKQ